jgi:centromere-localized protein 2
MEIEQLRQEEETLMESVRQTVGGLSDLRYGKFANAKVGDEVKDGLETLRETCDSK